MDKSWIHLKNRIDPKYVEGMDTFLEFAYSQQGVNNRIRCPCNKCRNTCYKYKSDIRHHLLHNGFLKTYDKIWANHGEVSNMTSESSNLYQDSASKEYNFEEGDIIGMVHDVFGFINMDAIGNDQHNNEEPNENARNFFNLLKDADPDLDPNCENMSKLSFIVRLLHLKCLNH